MDITEQEKIEWIKKNPFPNYGKEEKACEVPYNWNDLKDMGKLQEVYEWLSDVVHDNCVNVLPEDQAEDNKE